MKVTLRLFASARDAFGFDTREIILETPSLAAIRTILLHEHPAAEPVLRSCRFAVNMEYVAAEVRLKDGDEIAMIPPVSGG